ncbi:hypothetical protein E2C01_008773 [Portunus trituberculatus]|uniref:Uncharacterized protein n=1 Tax=Portunus trituberculatus TaxID=210409 RepID=A0A5B7D1P6_PORTR|nr:hypothetical protein [Portunus trituberculatus]
MGYRGYFLGCLLSQSPPARKPSPRMKEAQPTLGPWTGFEPVRLETPRTPKHACGSGKVARQVQGASWRAGQLSIYVGHGETRVQQRIAIAGRGQCAGAGVQAGHVGEAAGGRAVGRVQVQGHDE